LQDKAWVSLNIAKNGPINAWPGLVWEGVNIDFPMIAPLAV
jgi:hypothetical protein